jgi:hypothetical protein
MPPRDTISVNYAATHDARIITPENSISSSLHGSELEQDQEYYSKHDHQARTESTNWSLLVPVIGTTIMLWAQKANARIRQHATACCTGDFCVVTETVGPTIPEEISFQKCKNQSRQSPTESSLRDQPIPTLSKDVSTAKTDIELTTFEASSVAGTDTHGGKSEYDASWMVPHPIRRTKWNEIPHDPVDEVSLKGSSMYMSEEGDDSTPNTEEDDDGNDVYDQDIKKLQRHWERMRKRR